MKRVLPSSFAKAVAISVIGVVGLIVGAPPVSADLCIDDQWKAHNGNTQDLTCTANDVRIAEATNVRDLENEPLTSCYEGFPFDFIADFTVELTAQERFDVGLYFATDGDPNEDGALTGTCDANLVLDEYTSMPDGVNITFGSDNWVNLDPDLTPASKAQHDDTCGDIDDAHNPQVVTVLVEQALCSDTDGDGYVNLPNCTSWRQPGSNEVCDDVTDAFPGSPSKCNCDITFNIPVLVETPTGSLTKQATKAVVTYSVTVYNDGTNFALNLDDMVDNQVGGDGSITSIHDNLVATTCSVPQTIATEGSYSCTFDVQINSPGSDTTITNTVTASGTSSNPNADPFVFQGIETVTVDLDVLDPE